MVNGIQVKTVHNLGRATLRESMQSYRGDQGTIDSAVDRLVDPEQDGTQIDDTPRSTHPPPSPGRCSGRCIRRHEAAQDTCRASAQRSNMGVADEAFFEISFGHILRQT